MRRSHFLIEAHAQPEALYETVVAGAPARADLVALLHQVRRVVLVGSGDSYYLGAAAVVALERLGGVVAESVEAYDFVSGRVEGVDPQTLVVGISASGKAVRTLQALKLARRRGALTVALTNAADSPLSAGTAAVLPTAGGPSYSFPTRTTTTALVVLVALAADLGTGTGRLPAAERDAVLLELAVTLPERVQQRLADATGLPEAARAVVAARHVLVVGSGAARTAAWVGAAKLYETCRRHAVAVNAEEYLHLLGFAVGADDVVVVAPTAATHERELQAATYAARQGATVVAVTPWAVDDARLPSGTLAVPVAGHDLAPWSGAVLASVALHLLAVHCAALLGTDPDRPDGVDLDWVLNELLYTAPLAGW